MKSWIKRYWLPTILSTVGVVTILIGIGSATLWAPPTKISATTQSTGSINLATTSAGVLSLYDSPVKITVAGSGKIALAVGRSQDVSGWVHGQPHLQINGLSSITELNSTKLTGKDKPLSPVSSEITDMWQFYKTSNKGTITTTWPQAKGNFSIIAWSEKAPVKVTLQWQQTPSHNLLYPLLGVGSLLLIVGIILGLVLYRIALAAKREWEETQARRKMLQETSQLGTVATQTTGIPLTADISQLTRRPSRKELREARNRGQESIKIDGMEYPTGLIPAINTDTQTQPTPETSPQPQADTDENPSNVEDNHA